VKVLASLMLLAMLLAPLLPAQTTVSIGLGLTAEQVPSDCKIVDGSFPVDIQTAILWDKTDLYKSLISLPIDKNAQSFSCAGDRGTVYSFQFADEAKRKTAAAFIKPLLWGEPGPTPDHPELVLEAGAVLTVVSFRKAPKSLLGVIQRNPTAGAKHATTADSSDFGIPGHGSLRLTLPDGWQAQSRTLSNPPSVTLHFIPASGDAFDVQVTAVWLDPDKRSKETTESLRATVQRTAAELLPHSIEKTATLHDIRGSQSVGFYYALTDNNPGPGEFTNLTQGVFLTGEVLSTFTILQRTAVSGEADQALEAFRQAAYGK
jgi:hypothetical protein